MACRLKKRCSDRLPKQKRNRRDFGAIALDINGAIGWGKTSNVLLAAYHDGEKIGDTLEVATGTEVGCIENKSYEL